MRRLGIARAGATAQPHVRPWSTVLRVPTTKGDLYFKASAPVQAYEVPLLQSLIGEFADRLPDVLVFDPGRAWMLMRDGGTQFLELVKTRDDLHHWLKVAPLYADLQLRTAARADELIRVGVPDLRLEHLPSRFAELVERADVSDEERAPLRAATSRLRDLCAALSNDGIPETVQHNDLHAANVFMRDGRYRIFDWGDTSISHPFQTLWIALAFAGKALSLPTDDPVFHRVRDAYLEPWTERAPRDVLLRSFAAARTIGHVSNALTFDVQVAAMTESTREPYLESVPRLLRRLLEDL